MNELREAGRAVAKGRTDEALVHLWNALEPVRLAGGASALEEAVRLATEIGRRGGPGERREAERLLRALRREPGAGWAEPPAPAGEWADPETETARVDVGEHEPVPDGGVEAGPAEPEAAAGTAEGTGEQEGPQPRRSPVARRLLPLLFVIIVLVNLLNRLLHDH